MIFLMTSMHLIFYFENVFFWGGSAWMGFLALNFASLSGASLPSMFELVSAYIYIFIGGECVL